MSKKLFSILLFLFALFVFIYGLVFDKTELNFFDDEETIQINYFDFQEKSIYEDIVIFCDKYYDCTKQSYATTEKLETSVEFELAKVEKNVKICPTWTI